MVPAANIILQQYLGIKFRVGGTHLASRGLARGTAAFASAPATGGGSEDGAATMAVSRSVNPGWGGEHGIAYKANIVYKNFDDCFGVKK